MSRAARSGRRSAAEVEQVLADLRSSGLSQKAFAVRRGIPLSTLTWWRRRQREEAATATSDSPRLVPVTIHEGGTAFRLRSSNVSGYEVLLRSGHAVWVPVGFDAEDVGRLVAALEHRC